MLSGSRKNMEKDVFQHCRLKMESIYFKIINKYYNPLLLTFCATHTSQTLYLSFFQYLEGNVFGRVAVNMSPISISCYFFRKSVKEHILGLYSALLIPIIFYKVLIFNFVIHCFSKGFLEVAGHLIQSRKLINFFRG